MRVPSFKAVREMAKAASEYFTIACCECRRPLWRVKLGERYGTRISAEKIPFPGVPSYDEYWEKNMNPKRTDCPFCKKAYFKAVVMPDGKFAAVPLVLEFE